MEKDQEEIIELTEVWTEPANEETRTPDQGGSPVNLPNYEKELVKIKEELRGRIDQWLATEGARVINQGIKEIIPPLFGEELGRELEKLKSEVEKIRVLKEGLSAKIREWLNREGTELVKKETKDALPKIGEDLLGKEINQLQEEVEKIKGLREALNQKAEQWLHTEGVSFLQEKAAEVLPQIGQAVLSREIEKWQKEWLRIKEEQETWALKIQSWLAQEGETILANKAREMFPEIATAILQREIAKLKGEVEE